MARAYAIELRLRVIKAVEAGIRISKVSKQNLRYVWF